MFRIRTILMPASDIEAPNVSQLIVFAGWTAGLMLCLGCGSASTRSSENGTARKDDAILVHQQTVTFNRDIAPLVWKNCTQCHRPGEAAPFPLVTYSDVQKRGRQIATVTRSRFMPPWLAEPGPFAFENELRLSEQDISLLQKWVETGATEGNADDLPPPPTWTTGWNLGEPDLVVTMPEPFVMPVDGPDVYRNFVVPIPVTGLRYVRAMEFRPGNYRIVHHAFMMIDPTRKLRRLTPEDGQPGFAGMDTRGARSPGGHLIGWQPGRRPYVAPEGTAWRLFPGTDLVLQMHMQPTGKEERIQASVGLYFTDRVPERVPVKLALRSTEIDISPGDSDYTIENYFMLPVDVQVLAIAPHAHYLGKEMYGIATLPDGTQQNLLEIRAWDLNWQREYRYLRPVVLPRGTKLTQRFVYDNSTANVRNPSHPPKRVRFGPQATDEMGSLWFQLMADDASARRKLENAMMVQEIKESYSRHRTVLADDPTNAESNVELGKIAVLRKMNLQAIKHFRVATRSDPTSADAHYHLGQTLLRSGHEAEGQAELQRALECDPQYYQAHYDLGWADYLVGKLSEAEQHFQAALRTVPYDTWTLENLGRIYAKWGRYDDAQLHFKKALESRPDDQSLLRAMKRVSSEKSP